MLQTLSLKIILWGWKEYSRHDTCLAYGWSGFNSQYPIWSREHCQKWCLSTKSGICPEHCQVWSENKWKMFQYFREIVTTLKRDKNYSTTHLFYVFLFLMPSPTQGILNYFPDFCFSNFSQIFNILITLIFNILITFQCHWSYMVSWNHKLLFKIIIQRRN